MRIVLAYAFRKYLVKKLDIYDPNLNLKESLLVVWSDFARRIHEELGAPSNQVLVVPPGIKKASFTKRKHQGVNILFIGVWFKRKGGLLLLEAYRILKKRFPEIKLILVGQLPAGIDLPRDTWHRDYLPRERLMKEVFPLADILVLVPPLSEGYGLVVHEAASFGLPTIVSRVYALPELVEDQKTGLVIPPGSLEALVAKLELLISNRRLREEMGRTAQKRFLERFWVKKTNESLLKVYQTAMRR